MNTSNTSEDGIWGLENDDPVTDNEDDNEYHSEEEEEDPTEAIVETGMETGAQEKINKADGHMEQSGNEQDLGRSLLGIQPQVFINAVLINP